MKIFHITVIAIIGYALAGAIGLGTLNLMTENNSLQNEIVPLIIKLKRKGVLIYSSVRDIIDQQVNTNKLDKILNLFNGVFVH